jgi:hypothetical protein
MGRASELVATPIGGCGSCIPCVTRSGSPCVLGHRRQALANPHAPVLAGARLSGRTLPAANKPFTALEVLRRPPAESPEPVVFETGPEPMVIDPCRASWCTDLELHGKHRKGR